MATEPWVASSLTSASGSEKPNPCSKLSKLGKMFLTACYRRHVVSPLCPIWTSRITQSDEFSQSTVSAATTPKVLHPEPWQPRTVGVLRPPSSTWCRRPTVRPQNSADKSSAFYRVVRQPLMNSCLPSPSSKPIWRRTNRAWRQTTRSWRAR